MKRMLPKPLRPYAAPIAVAGAAAITITTAFHPVAMMVAGGILAATICMLVTVEYLILVPLRKNPGAKRLAFLLIALDLLLGLTVVRYFFRDLPLNRELLALMFWGLFLSLLYLGWHVWMDQLEGAKAYMRKQQDQTERKP